MGPHQTRRHVKPGQGNILFVRMFSSAVIDQALLSAASLIVGLILIRYSTDLQYGYYVLAWTAFLLLVSLQNAFIGPAMVARLTRLEGQARGDLVGGMYRGQRKLVLGVAAACGVVALMLAVGGKLDRTTGPLLAVSVIAGLAILNREFFRLTLVAHRRPGEVLRADLPYAVLLIGGAWLATRTPQPAAAAVAVMGLAALVGSVLLYRAFRRTHFWNYAGAPGMIRQIAPVAVWSVAGAAIHWTFSQGYSYLVAGVLDVAAVAAIAATRLLLMPVNLLSMGIQTTMLPIASGWLMEHSVGTVLRRLSLFGLGVAGAALIYVGVMWLARDWIFATVLRKSFAERDTLLLLWSGIFLLMVVRDQLLTLLVARERFRWLTSLTALTAGLSIAVSIWAMHRYGQVGALLGMLAGEVVNLAGIVALALRERARMPAVVTA